MSLNSLKNIRQGMPSENSPCYAPRAASITADSDEVITWVLDRETFDHIVKEASTEKREKNENS
jgi:CRP-like cAMP-binding protein